MTNNIYQEVNEVFSILAANTTIKLFQNGVTKIGTPELISLDSDLHSPITGLKNKLQTKTSPLANQPIDKDLLQKLISELSKNNNIVGLNHIGFCYHVDSHKDERGALSSDKSISSIGLYEEQSNDEAKWYFVGNPDQTKNPMIELLPVESQNDTFIDYWLPHIHIDVDTNLDENQIESLIYHIYDGDPKPFRSLVIDDTVYVVRLRLGILDGINIFLDLATKHRNVAYQRQNLLKPVK